MMARGLTNFFQYQYHVQCSKCDYDYYIVEFVVVFSHYPGSILFLQFQKLPLVLPNMISITI